MNFELKEDEKLIRLEINGPIEMQSIKTFREKIFNLGETTNKDIEVDLRKVDYMDSSGIGLLITLYKSQKQKGKAFTIVNVSPRVIDLLRLSSLSDVID